MFVVCASTGGYIDICGLLSLKTMLMSAICAAPGDHIEICVLMSMVNVITEGHVDVCGLLPPKQKTKTQNKKQQGRLDRKPLKITFKNCDRVAEMYGITISTIDMLSIYIVEE